MEKKIKHVNFNEAIEHNRDILCVRHRIGILKQEGPCPILRVLRAAGEFIEVLISMIIQSSFPSLALNYYV